MAKRIAIVEDEAAIRDNYVAAFTREGYVVEGFESRSDAMQVFDVRFPALPHPLDRSLAVPMGLSLAWLGYALWSGRPGPATVPTPETGQALLSQAVAE